MTFVLFSEKSDKIFAVAELNFAIKQLLESTVPLLWVRGEISNLVKAASGHFYFLLKDGRAQVRCVMFRHKNQLVKDGIENGSEIEALVTVTLYEQRGDYQLTVEQIRPAGQGALYEKFAQLKQRLEDQGLFAQARKKPLPVLPRRIGIVTSPQAAALHDVLSVLKRRFASIPVVLYPAPVQGVGSAEKIAAAIGVANLRAECDVLILCRGGGSIEDLWAFNEEIVARAIAASHIPIVSGVGHETDFTIADFVADERAATPTAAAQRVVPDRLVLGAGLQQIALRMRRAQLSSMHRYMQSLDYLQRGLVHPAERLRMLGEQLSLMHQRVKRSFAATSTTSEVRIRSLAHRLTRSGVDIDRLQDRCHAAAMRLRAAANGSNQRRQMQVTTIAQHLTLLNPKQVLKRGYSLVQDAGGNVIMDYRQLEVAAEMQITFAHGWARARVTKSGDTIE